MGSVTSRTSLTTRGVMGLSSWANSSSTYSILQLTIGSNPNSKLEIVSALNTFKLAVDLLFYRTAECYSKYNPKVYLGAIQTTAKNWNLDWENGDAHPLGNPDKSGSWPV